MHYLFTIQFLEPALQFIESLEPKSQEKVLYVLWKARITKDVELFKKISADIWEFRVLHKKKQYRLLSFWYKSETEVRCVICTHGFIKKTAKTPALELQKAQQLRLDYINSKHIKWKHIHSKK